MIKHAGSNTGSARSAALQAEVEAPAPLADDAPGARRHRWIWLGCIALVVAAALHSADCSIGGGDTWVALANGRFTMGPWAERHPGRTWQMKLLDHFGIHLTKKDYMGAKTRPYVPGDKKKFGWVNQNWLTHVLFYNLRRWWGENSIVIYKFVQAILTALLAYWAGRKLGAHPVLAAAAAAFGMLLSRSFIDLRPNQSTIFYAAAMMLVLVYWRSGRHKALWWLVPIMLLWGNVHGGFIYAMMVFGVVLAGHALQNYLGKGAYAFLLLGLLVSIWLLINNVLGFESSLAQRVADGELSPAMAQRYTRLFAPWKLPGALALVGFMLLLGGVIWRYPRIVSSSFVHVGTRGMWYLLAGTAAVVLIPGIFSPFGFENVSHPLVVATGEEGRIWRQVVEWRPIWDPAGFGNAGPYKWFLALFAGALFLWGMVYLLLHPAPPAQERKRRRQAAPPPWWPKIDLAFIGVIAITLIMSLKSRRFIFLGGVVLAPFLAVKVQEIVNMIGIFRARRRGQERFPVLPRRLRALAAAASWVAAALVGTVFGACMWDVYFRDAYDGERLSVFRRMVGIGAQPVAAVPFFDLNQLEGIVFNEWVNGGFITFWQTPQKQNGEARCKVYMDGRAQAAYDLEHFQRWNALKRVVLVRPDGRSYTRVRELARRFKLSMNAPDLYDQLVRRAAGDRQLSTELERLARHVPQLQAELLRRQLRYLGRSLGLDPQDPDFYDRLVRWGHRGMEQYEKLTALAAGDARLYDALLRYEGINVALPGLRKPSGETTLDLLMQLDDWRLLYLDEKNAILVRRDGKRNQALLNDPLGRARYPDETSRHISQGYALCFETDPALRRQGLELLTSVTPPHYNRRVYKTIFDVGRQLGQLDQIRTYFERERTTHRTAVLSGQRFGRLDHVRSWEHSCSILRWIAQRTGRRQVAREYAAEQKKAQEAGRQLARDMARQRWLW